MPFVGTPIYSDLLHKQYLLDLINGYEPKIRIADPCPFIGRISTAAFLFFRNGFGSKTKRELLPGWK